MNRDLTVGNPASVLWKFCLPLFGRVIFQQLYNIADSLTAGKFIGENVPAVGFSIGFERIFSIVTENNITLAGSRRKTAILYKEDAVLEAIARSSELEAESDVTLILVPNPKKVDKIYSRTKSLGFDEIIKIDM